MQQLQLAGASSPGLVERKIKISAVLDQGDDSEVKPMDPAKIRVMISEWRELENDGEDPQEEEEATGDQLASLDFRVRQGGTPFVDFAVWRPFGARFGRLLKFSAYLPLPSGGFQTKEINGPASFEDWKKSWRVFAFAMVVLKVASKTKLEKYEFKISKLNETYPGMWWIIGMADIRMRSEHMERVRRKIAREHAAFLLTVPSGTCVRKVGFDPMMPWDGVFRAAARDDHFWNENVDKKALMFAAHLRTSSQLADDGVGAVVESSFPASVAGAAGKARKRSRSASPEPKRKRGKKGAKEKKESSSDVRAPRDKGGSKGKNNDEKGRDGRYYREASGNQLCWTWNHSPNGCSTTCSNRRAHACEWCRKTDHRSIACSLKPIGWTPP